MGAVQRHCIIFCLSLSVGFYTVLSE